MNEASFGDTNPNNINSNSNACHKRGGRVNGGHSINGRIGGGGIRPGDDGFVTI